MVADGLPKVFKDKRMIQKVLFLFRASPFAPVRGGGYPESTLSRYYPTHTDAKGEALKRHKSFCSFLCEYIKRIWKRMRNITPSAKRNSYRVAILVGVYTQGSVLRPQPEAPPLALPKGRESYLAVG